MTDGLRHSWDLTPREAIALQRQLAGRVRHEPCAGPVNTVAGVDCAFTAGGRRIIAAAVLMEAPAGEVIARAYAVDSVGMPYVPGLLSFREAPAEVAAIGQLPRRPDLLLVDGCGVAHPRRLGIASHLGLWLDLPTIGVAKSRLCGAHRAVGRRRRCRVRLLDDGEVIGAVVRTRDDVRPVYVSVGHRITLDEAVAWTLRTARRYRLPEPIRAADRMAGQLKRLL
ncbi:MAG: deoxyribonuclease V [Planctomycetota bacterium]